MSNLKDFLGGLDPAVWTDAKAAYLDDNISTKAPASTALSTATWTNTRASYLDSSISSRAPASTALSSNVWTTTYRNRIDTTISSRLSTCSTQHLATNTTTNSYSTWTVSSVNTSQSFLSACSGGYNWVETYWGIRRLAMNARIINSTNVRYVYYKSDPVSIPQPGFEGTSSGYAVALDLVRIY